MAVTDVVLQIRASNRALIFWKEDSRKYYLGLRIQDTPLPTIFFGAKGPDLNIYKNELKAITKRIENGWLPPQAQVWEGVATIEFTDVSFDEFKEMADG